MVSFTSSPPNACSGRRRRWPAISSTWLLWPPASRGPLTGVPMVLQRQLSLGSPSQSPLTMWRIRSGVTPSAQVCAVVCCAVAWGVHNQSGLNLKSLGLEKKNFKLLFMYYIYVTGHYLGKGISMLLAISRLGTCYTTYSYMLLDSYITSYVTCVSMICTYCHTYIPRHSWYSLTQRQNESLGRLW